MAKCAFCGKQLGMFTGEMKIPGTEYSYCESHSEYRARMYSILEENIDADLSGVIEQMWASLKQRASTCEVATEALVSSLVKLVYERMGDEESAQAAEVTAVEEIKRKEQLRLEEEARILEIVKGMQITTGFDFQGYRITKYCDIIFDELIMGMGFFKAIAASFDNFSAAVVGKEAGVVSDRLNQVKSTLRDRVKDKAARIGANALIGVDFESSSVGDLLMVSMTATAVVIEPEREA